MRLIRISACALVLVVTTRPGVAAADGFSNVECTATPAVCQLDAGSRHVSGSPDAETGTSEGWLADCRFEVAGSSATIVHDAKPGTWYYLYCPGQPTPQFPGFFPDLAPAVSPAELAALARSRLVLPEPDVRLNPVRQLVGLPAWFWLASWSAVSATASVPGVSVEATARPRSVTWATGDGSRVVCGGPGTAYDGRTDPSAPSPDCGHTYRRPPANPTGSYPVTVTIEWSVAWSGAGQTGTLPPLFTTTQLAVPVAEAPVLATSGGTDGWGADR